MSLKLVVIGSNGFIGQRLCAEVSKLKELYISPTVKLPLSKLICFDKTSATSEFKSTLFSLNPNPTKKQIAFVTGDLCDKSTVENLLNPTNYSQVTVIHLAAILSGYSETDFDLGMKVNFHGTLNILECLREVSLKLNSPQILFYSSTDYTLAFNEQNRSRPWTEDSFRLSPVSYGCQKACMEIMISDYTRKKFIDGRVGRFCAVLGKAQFVDVLSFAWHGIYTQPLQGLDYKCSLPLNIGIPCCSLTNVVNNVIYLASKVDSDQIGHNRVIALPAKPFTLQEIWNETQIMAKEYEIQLGRLIQVDEEAGQATVKKINVCSRMSYEKARLLKCDVDIQLKEIITDFIQHNVIPEQKTKRFLSSKM